MSQASLPELEITSQFFYIVTGQGLDRVI